MKSLSVTEAKAQLSKLLKLVAKGKDITITKHGRDVARLVAVTNTGPRQLGKFEGKIKIADDFDVTPKWLLDAFEGKPARRQKKKNDV